MFTNKNLPCIIDLDFKNFPSEVIFHQGRTDKNGGHTDLFNKSGLGLYHFHHRLSAHLHNKTNPICPYENTQTFIINPHNGKKVPIGQPYIVEDVKYYSINLVSKALVFLDYMGGVKSSSDAVDGKFYICSTFDSSIISSYEEFTFIYPKSILMIKNNTFFKTQNDKLQLISNSKSTDTVNCYAYISLNEIKNHMLKNGYFTDFTDDGNDVWSFKRKNNVIIKSPKNGDLFKVGDVLKVEIYTNNVMYATLNIGNYKELKNSIENENIVTFSDYIFTSDNIGNLDIEVKVGDSIYLDTASSTVQVLVEGSGDSVELAPWLIGYKGRPNSSNGINTTYSSTEWEKLKSINGVIPSQVDWYSYENQSKPNQYTAPYLTDREFNLGSYKELTDENGRYWITLGPKVLIPNYPDAGELNANEFTDYIGCRVDIVLRNDKDGTYAYIECVWIGNIKAHTYDNGIYQTGHPYPNSASATLEPYKVEYVNGSMVEFTGYQPSTNGTMSKYSVVELIVYPN